PLHLALVARDHGGGQPRTLPQLVMVDLGHGRAEAVLELRLRRLDELALTLERARLRELELDREDADVAGAHSGIQAARGRRDLGSGRAGRSRFAQIGALDLARLVRLEDVAFAQVVEAVEQDAALEALAHLAGVLLEALQLRDRGVLDHGAV